MDDDFLELHFCAPGVVPVAKHAIDWGDYQQLGISKWNSNDSLEVKIEKF